MTPDLPLKVWFAISEHFAHNRECQSLRHLPNFVQSAAVKHSNESHSQEPARAAMFQS